MKGVHLFPQEEKQQGLNAPPGRAEIVDTDYDPVINMTFAEYESNLKKHAEQFESVHEKLSGLVLGLIAAGALSNAWNPVGWVLGAIVAVMQLLSAFKVFDEKSAWDKDRAMGAWNRISNFYQASVLGEPTGEKTADGKDKYTGGLTSIMSPSHFTDETVQTIMNVALKGLCIYEAVFYHERNRTSWKSDETKANLDQLVELCKKLKQNFLSKLKSYEKVYHIEYQKIPVILGDSLFTEDLNILKVRVADINIHEPFTDVTFEFISIKLKRKAEYVGASIPFTDFIDAASSKATELEKILSNDELKKQMFTLGAAQIELQKLKKFITADEADELLFKNWMNTAPAYDKAEYSYNWNMPFDPKAAQNRNLTEGDYLSQKCQGMDRVLQDFANKVPPYQNATAQDVIKVLKDAKAHHDKQYKGKPGSGFCKSVARGGSPGAAYALKKFGINLNDYDEDFNLKKIERPSAFTNAIGETDTRSNRPIPGVEVPNGYTDERVKAPVPKATPPAPAPAPLAPNATPEQPKPQPAPNTPTAPAPVKPSAPANTLQAENKTPQKQAPKKKSLWWLWILAIGTGYYMLKDQQPKKKENG